MDRQHSAATGAAKPLRLQQFRQFPRAGASSRRRWSDGRHRSAATEIEAAAGQGRGAGGCCGWVMEPFAVASLEQIAPPAWRSLRSLLHVQRGTAATQ